MGLKLKKKQTKKKPRKRKNQSMTEIWTMSLCTTLYVNTCSQACTVTQLLLHMCAVFIKKKKNLINTSKINCCSSSLNCPDEMRIVAAAGRWWPTTEWETLYYICWLYFDLFLFSTCMQPEDESSLRTTLKRDRNNEEAAHRGSAFT